MAQGRGSAAISRMLVFFMLVFHSHMAYANTYAVGDARGWTFNIVRWPNGKQFRTGDTLAFKYVVGAHNVVLVNKAGYDTCTTPSGSPVYESGNDQLRLVRGMNYFICNFPGHCEGGMKIAVNAL